MSGHFGDDAKRAERNGGSARPPDACRLKTPARVRPAACSARPAWVIQAAQASVQFVSSDGTQLAGPVPLQHRAQAVRWIDGPTR